jgi:uracil-DNA glycosylase
MIRRMTNEPASYLPLGNDWDDFLRRQVNESYWRCLQRCVAMERTCLGVYPPADMVLEALRLTSRAETRVVIVGQDPYFRPDQAHGLAFSVPKDVKPPPSLRNILSELRDDGCPETNLIKGNLEPWARRGVLLLNATLTVREGVPGSHRGMGWEEFTDRILRELDRTGCVVFMLLGKEAQKRKKLLVNTSPDMIISLPHPRTAAFRGTRPFRHANEALINAGCEPINWCLQEPH